MVFSSELFLFYFLPCALAVYFLARGRGRNAVLAAISYLFYGWANPLFMVLMVASTVVDYICGRVMTGEDAGRTGWSQFRSRRSQSFSPLMVFRLAVP